MLVGVSWSSGQTDFIAGVMLAVNEINASGGILGGKKLKIIVDEREVSASPAEYSALARTIAVDFASKGVIAVIGHRFSGLAIPASNIYEQNKIIFIAPTASNLALTRFGFKYVFRLFPNNDQMGQQLALYARKRGYERVALLYDRRDYSREFSGGFERAAANYDMRITFRQSFFANVTDSDLIRIIVNLKKNKDVDAILLVTTDTLAARLYEKARQQGIQQPFIGSDSMDSDVFWKVVRRWEGDLESKDKTVVPSIYNHNSYLTQQFIEKFVATYQQTPDRFAALGYDSIKVLTHAIGSVESIEPVDIADGLRYLMSPCQGATGKHAYFENGDLDGKRLYMKFVYKDDFQYVAPFNITSFSAMQHYMNAQAGECANLDKDSDGILDYLDACPNNSALEISKGVYPDGEKRGCPLDTDADKVPDFEDMCPQDTPETVAQGVGLDGCLPPPPLPEITEETASPTTTTPEITLEPADADKDGINDVDDKCVNTSSGSVVNAEGCSAEQQINPAVVQTTDTDMDGVLDGTDQCAETPANIVVNEQGCPEQKTEKLVLAGNKYLKTSVRQPTATAYKEAIQFVQQWSPDLIQLIEVVSYTDPKGNALTNQRLSEERAKQVAENLIGAGLPPEKVRFVGKGQENSADTTITTRRLEITLERFVAK
ncbi:ABC transporter substrate-binding protein [Beggiatoa leptomitoformis]|uniref:ABC transporter substrate-binding protein n=1 Tax=Beggiatoa leptomitoformis TaxID=288004 RepID=UPI0007064844|nr:ABC transporter substrate-binding protein [Beggiatoa leptomitoformis]